MTAAQPQAGSSHPQRVYDPPSSPPPGARVQEGSEETFYTPPPYPPPGATEDRTGATQSPAPASAQVQESAPAQERLPTAIPDDYRERHRQREREQSRQRDADP